MDKTNTKANMLRHIVNHSTYRFFVLYCMILKREKQIRRRRRNIDCIKLLELGYPPILLILNFIKHENYKKVDLYYINYRLVSSFYSWMRVEQHFLYEEEVEKCYDTNVESGIKLTYKKDPINMLKYLICLPKNKYFVDLNYLHSVAASEGHVKCLEYINKLIKLI